MNSKTRNLILALAAAVIVVGCGAIEDWYGRFDYGADGIAYLDLSKALESGNWTMGISPYWSVGYPSLLSLARGLFPADSTGEWTALRVVNLLCFLGTYLSFLYFLSVCMEYASRAAGAEQPGSGKGFVIAIGTCLFLLLELTNGAVSRVSPDLLVGGFFFLINAVALNYFLRPAARTAICLGLVMGLGYIVKAIFLPISAAMLFVILWHASLRPRKPREGAMRNLGWAVLALAFVALPCVAATSKILGRFTLGETGSLNYAWNVNGLPHGTDWQGGPGSFGAPIHPPHLLSQEPPVFEFEEPFHVTYPPIFNQFYWYDGYRNFFNMHNQLHALKIDFAHLLECFATGPHLFVKALAVVAAVFSWIAFLRPAARREWLVRCASMWPLFLASIAGLLLYLVVVVEPRYVIAFLVTLATLPFVALYVPTKLVTPRSAHVMTTLFVLGLALVLVERKGEMFRRALVNESYLTDQHWTIGRYLVQAGLRPEDKVASVTVGPGVFCTWAHVSGVHIVAEIGNNTFDPNDQEKDFETFAGHPDVQQRVFDLFRRTGAVMVVVPQARLALQGSGWEHIPGTEAWIHRLD